MKTPAVKTNVKHRNICIECNILFNTIQETHYLHKKTVNVHTVSVPVPTEKVDVYQYGSVCEPPRSSPDCDFPYFPLKGRAMRWSYMWVGVRVVRRKHILQVESQQRHAIIKQSIN